MRCGDGVQSSTRGVEGALDPFVGEREVQEEVTGAEDAGVAARAGGGDLQVPGGRQRS
jgi:hypothetical protein